MAASISQGTPIDGKSVGRMFFTRARVFFIDLVAALMCASRRSGSAMWVPRLTRVIEAWLSALALPFSRNDTGTAATIDWRGSGPCLPKCRRSAVLHSISTMSLSVAPCRRPSAFNSCSGNETAAKARPLVTEAFRRVRGASPRLPLRFLPVTISLRDATCVAADESDPTAPGSARISCAICCTSLPMAPEIISTSPSSKRLTRPELRASSGAGLGLKSRIALASATAAWPSTAAWCSWV